MKRLPIFNCMLEMLVPCSIIIVMNGAMGAYFMKAKGIAPGIAIGAAQLEASKLWDKYQGQKVTNEKMEDELQAKANSSSPTPSKKTQLESLKYRLGNDLISGFSGGAFGVVL